MGAPASPAKVKVAAPAKPAAPAKKKSTGTMVMEAIVKSGEPKKKKTHLEVLVQEAAMSAAGQAAHKAGKLGGQAAKTAKVKCTSKKCVKRGLKCHRMKTC